MNNVLKLLVVGGVGAAAGIGANKALEVIEARRANREIAAVVEEDEMTSADIDEDEDDATEVVDADEAEL